MATREDALPAKDAIIFIPGLGQEIVDQRLETIARKLAGALDRQTPRAKLLFKVIGLPEEEYGNAYRAQVRSISMYESGKEEIAPIADIYEFDFKENLTRRFESRSPFSKVLVMAGILIQLGWRFFRSIRKRSKDLKDKLQILTIGLIMLAMTAFIASILWAGIQTIDEIRTYGPEILLAPLSGKEKVSDTNNSGNKKTDEKSGPRLSFLQALVVLLAALGLFKQESLKEKISTVATEYVCASNYLRLANQKQVILGQVTSLLEHIAEKKEKYDGVYIVSYSFGTLIAIDLLFPHTRPGARLAMVKGLVTIGCPFDLVRTYWPNYFTQRLRVKDIPRRWLNLYAPLDVFGSNFRNDNKRIEADQGVSLQDSGNEVVPPDTNIAYDAGLQTEQLSWFDVFTVKGIKLHNQYWADEDVPELSCFDSIVMELFKGAPALWDSIEAG